MASVAPSVLVAVVLLVSMLSILGGVVQHYSSVLVEPELLPAYGTVYVEGVEPQGYTVTVVNRFGYTVRALFTVYVVDVGVGGVEPPSPHVTFWVDLRPGRNHIKLVDYVREALGLPGDADVRVDLAKSSFTIGGVVYPLEPGAGLLPPVERGRRVERLVASGLGVESLGLNGRYCSIVFESGEATVFREVAVKMGYERSIYGYWETEEVTREVEGYRCRCWYREYTGYVAERERRGGVDPECYERCHRECVTECYWDCWMRECLENPDPWCSLRCWGECYWKCARECRERCRREGEVVVCREATCHHRDCEKYYVREVETVRFKCAYDGGVVVYWTDAAYAADTLRFSTAALYAGGAFTTPGLARDTVEHTVVEDDYVTGEWPYILEDQSECRYRYSRVKCEASLQTRAFKACDSVCGVTRYYRECVERCRVVSGEGWACGRWGRCAGTDRFLYVRLRTVRVNATTPLAPEGVVKMAFNITFVLDYRMARVDPEAATDKIRLWFKTGLTLGLPRVLGYIGLAYPEELKSVTVTVKARVVEAVVSISTASGFRLRVHPEYSVGYWSYSVEVSPVGYVVENAKTFRYATERGSVVTVTVEAPRGGYTMPRLWSDTVTVTVYLEVEIHPVLVVEVETG